MPTKSNRGGPRNTGRKMPSNTSNLCAIRFGIEKGILQVYVAYNDEHGTPRRTQYSVGANGQRGACEKAVAKRVEAGMPAPSLNQAVRALREFAS